MSNFLKSLFGAKKAAKVTKSRMQTRRLELIGLEERITPATITLSTNTVVITLGATESITDLNTSTASAVITVNTVGSANNTTALASNTGVTVTNNTVVIDTAVLSGFTGISVVGGSGVNAVTVGATGIDLTAGTTAATAQIVSLDLTTGGSADTLTVSGAIKTKGAGAATLSSPTLSIGAAGDITTSTGNVAITGTTISTAGDVTTTSGAIGYTGAVTLTGNVATTSTLAAGNLSITGALALSTFNFTANQGLGDVTTISSGVTGSGALSLTGAAVTPVGVINTTGTLTALATTGALTFAGAVTAVSVDAKATAGDVTFSAAVATSGTAGVNAKATAGNVIFGSTVGATGGAFTAEATTIATKSVRLENKVTFGSTGSNALITGNVLTTAATGELFTAGLGNITITGNVDAETASDDLALTVTSGTITISGAVGSASPAMGDLTANGTGIFLATGNVTAEKVLLGNTALFGTSVTFSGDVKATGASGVKVTTQTGGTIFFAKSIVNVDPAADVDLTTVSGALTVTGLITAKDDVLIDSTSGLITLGGAISTDSADGLVTIGNISGNIVTSAGVISTTGATANISIGASTSGNVTLGGNISTVAASLSVGDSASTGALISNGTLTSTGAGAINVLTGTGTAVINKAISSGAGVALTATGAAGTITLAGAVTSVGAVTDSGAGKLSLGANITTTAGNITLSSLATTLTSDVSLKAVGTINLASVNGNKNLTLESTGGITLTSVGQTTTLNTVTVTNANGVTAGAFSAAKVVLTDATAASTIAFGGTTVITTSLTTAAKAYNVSFAGTTSIAGAPVFLNTGNVTFGGTTVLSSGATITGGTATAVSLAGTIVSSGAFNIGASPATTTITTGTNLSLNSATAASTFAGKVVLASGDNLNLLGVGTLTLSGDSSTTGVVGNISVLNGTLNVTGKIGAASLSTATNGTISGAGGTIGALTVNTGTVAPGGTLKTAAVTMNAATNYSAAVLTATTASNLESAAAINLGGSVLSLSSVAAGLAVGNTFTIINNTHASNAITGTFANQVEGSSISAKDTAGNTVAFTVSYKGGTNANDVTLKVASITTTTPAPTAPAQPMVAGQPALLKFTAVGADAGGGPLVTITFQNGTYVSFFAYASTFTGGVRVALGDVDGNGSVDVITGAGPGGGPQANVYNVNTATGAVSLQKSFFAFSAPSFTGGIYVAAGDTNADGFDDVIIGAGATGGSRVQVYAGSATGVVTTSTLNDFFAYSPAFTGGVVVAAGQRDAVAGEEIITAPASGGGYNIKSFNAKGTGNSPTVVDNFFAFNNTTSVGGLSLAVGILNSGSIADLIVGTSNGGYGVIIDSTTSGITGTPFAGFTGAIRAGVAEDANGQDFAVALAGPTGAPRISVFSVGATQLAQTDSLFVMNTGFKGGLFGTPSL